MNGKRIGIGLILLSVGYLIFNVAIPFWLWLKVVSVIVSIIGVLIGLAFIGDALSVEKKEREARIRHALNRHVKVRPNDNSKK